MSYTREDLVSRAIGDVAQDTSRHADVVEAFNNSSTGYSRLDDIKGITDGVMPSLIICLL